MEALRPPSFFVSALRYRELLVGCGCGGATRCCGRSLRRRSCDAGGYVVGINRGLGDVGFTLPPEDGGKLLLSADVEEEREAVLLGILDCRAAELLRDLAEDFLDIGVVGVRGIFDIALESLGLVIDGLETCGTLLVRDGGGESLVLLLEGLEFSRLGVDGGLLGLVFLLNLEGGALGFVGRDDALFESDDGNLCGNRFGLDFGLCGRSCRAGGGCRGFGGLSQEGGGCEAGCQRSSKDKGTVHAVFETPYKDPDSGEIGWVSPGAKRRWEGCRTFLRP